MVKEQMKKALKDVELIESDFGRELTDTEVELVLNKGYKALLEKIEMDEEDYKTMRRCQRLITIGFTGSDKEYDEELAKENYQALSVFKSLVSDLEAVEEERKKWDVKINPPQSKEYTEENDYELDKYFTKESQEQAEEAEESYSPEHDSGLNKRFLESELEAIDLLFKGETVKLKPETIKIIMSYLEDKINYSLKINNNEVTLNFL